jgi:hypothetical protein
MKDRYGHTDEYGLRHLPHYLANSKWGQVESHKPAALIADCEGMSGDTELMLVQSALRLASHILVDQEQLAPQLS